MSKKTVLIADDDLETTRQLSLLIDYLKEADFEVKEAYNDIQALEIIKKEEKLDLLILDGTMPPGLEELN